MSDLDATETRARGALGRLASRALLVGGIALALSLVLPHVPRTQTITFRFDAARPIRRLDCSFTPSGEREPATAVTLRFSDPAPVTVRHEVRLANGSYAVAVEVQREGPSGALEETSWTRQVTLEGGETVLPLKDP